MLKTRTWILIILIAAVVLAAMSAVLLTRSGAGTVVEVVQDGTVLREIDLSRVAETYTFQVDWPGGGSNLVTVQPGRICVSEADCPDQICVDRGWLTDEAAPIVCLPHRLIIKIRNGAAG